MKIKTFVFWLCVPIFMFFAGGYLGDAKVYLLAIPLFFGSFLVFAAEFIYALIFVFKSLS